MANVCENRFTRFGTYCVRLYTPKVKEEELPDEYFSLDRVLTVHLLLAFVTIIIVMVLSVSSKIKKENNFTLSIFFFFNRKTSSKFEFPHFFIVALRIDSVSNVDA